ncbi:unnamed protein product [Owenia fusiformis]|uniref:Uncharacterized protein n=1 Tax=Owenia fusiformis TaxID=6347 RepID=A0A8J1XUU6_OWEFU|nr:unnamed protein product [Owenia fusiformis]
MEGGSRYKDKVAIITGGSKGIGEGCVRVFVRNGAKVVFCARGEKEGKALEEEVNKTGPGESLFLKCDVSKEDEIKNVVDITVEKFGRIDCLINNAGTHPSHKPIDDFSGEDFRNLLNINVVNYFLFSKFALPELRKVKGNIIMDSSLVAQIGQLGAVTYVSTKGAITSMCRALAIDEAKYEVRVNSFSPGNIWTPLWAAGAASSSDEKATIEGGKNAQLLGRFGTIEEAGQLCLFLAAEATFCTGLDIPLSGGAELNYGNKNRLGTGGNIYG